MVAVKFCSPDQRLGVIIVVVDRGVHACHPLAPGCVMKKAAVVLLLFAVGIGGAMLFRKPAEVGHLAQRRPALPPAPAQRTHDEIKKARPIVASPVQGVPALPPKQHVDSPQSQPQRPAVLQPGARPPLPQLSEFGSTGSFAKKAQVPPSVIPSQRIPAATSAPARDSQRSSVRATTEQMHTIVDGDTLDRISRRYLGDASWADVIYRMNSGIISDPNRLPLGEKIRIPSREQLTQSAPPSNASAADLVPLPQWTLKKNK